MLGVPKKVNRFLTNIFSMVDKPKSLKFFTGLPWVMINKFLKYLRDQSQIV